MRITMTEDRHLPAVGRLVRAGEDLDVDDRVAADLVVLGVATSDEDLTHPDRPAKSAPVGEWRTYAAERGIADVDDLSKPQLIKAVEAAEDPTESQED